MKTNLNEKAYEFIVRKLSTGELKPGQKLSEPSLAKACGVSRTPMREAVRRLVEEGVLYQVVTGQSGNAIMIGRSTDGLHFDYSRRPLHCHRLFVRRNYFYKATAVVHDGTLYVFFPRKSDRGTVRIVMRSMPINRLAEYFK